MKPTCLPPAKKAFAIEVGGSEDENTGMQEAGKDNKKDSISETKSGSDSLKTSTAASEALPAANTKGMNAYYQNFFNDAKFKSPVSDCGGKEEPLTTWLAFILGFGGGLLALLTPLCISYDPAYG